MRSVNHRYNENDPMQEIKWKPLLRTPINHLQVLKACDCFDYQACEMDNYKDTLAAEIVNRIRLHAIHKLPGYDKVEWEIKAVA